MSVGTANRVQRFRTGTVGCEFGRHLARYGMMFALTAAFFVAAFWESLIDIYNNWNVPASLYSHALIVPPISIFFVWQSRETLYRTPLVPSPALGLPILALGCSMLLVGDFLGFITIVHLAILPVLTGMCLLVLGYRAAMVLWFPLAFLIFMIPMPYSIVSTVAFESKLLATKLAVALGKTLTMSMVQDGSYVYLGGSARLLVGDICGGMRSLIALLAFGALVAYGSTTRWWARILILAVSPLVAVMANVARILFLCAIASAWGSDAATGTAHDASGIGIFVIAFVLLFSLEALLQKIAPEPTRDSVPEPATTPETGEPVKTVSYTIIPAVLGLALLGSGAAAHWTIALARDRAAMAEINNPTLDLPARIGYYRKLGEDIDPGDDVRRVLDTSSILMRYYDSPAGHPILLTIVYAGQKQRSLHFPENCLVGQGWEIEQAYVSPVGIEFEAKRLVVFRGDDKEAVLYWLKTGRHFTSSMFMNAVYWAREQLAFGTPTSSMIRLSMPIRRGQDPEDAFAILDDFATWLGPILLENIK